MRAVLLDVAWRCGRTIHARAHRGHPGKCPFVPTTCLDRFWRAPVHDPEKAFLIWAEGFSTEFRRLHPATTASRVARLIRHDYERQWSLATLGRRFHVTPSQLRRAFEREFGVSIRAYQQTVRVRAGAIATADFSYAGNEKPGGAGIRDVVVSPLSLVLFSR